MFALLYDNGHFMLSRNFKLQRVGDLHWLAQNYKFSKIAFSIDELVIIDVLATTKTPPAEDGKFFIFYIILFTCDF